MPEQKVDWKEAGKMLLEGFNYAEIADHFGVTRQWIQQYYTCNKHYMCSKDKYENDIVFPNLKKWFLEHNMNYRAFAAKCFPERNICTATAKVRSILIGQCAYFTLDQLYAMSKLTGMTVEEMFFKGTDA